MTFSYQLSRRRPQLMKSMIRKGVQRQLPEGYDVDTHFKPDYNPWDQRLCVVPDGDLFKALRDGQALDGDRRIDTFTEHGLKLAAGARARRPTSSSPPPGCSCWRSAVSSWPSTARRSTCRQRWPTRA